VFGDDVSPPADELLVSPTGADDDAVGPIVSVDAPPVGVFVEDVIPVAPLVV
jgi:hypothetical protein